MASMQTALRSAGVLTAVTVGLWIALAGPAVAVAGPGALEGLTYAALLCLVPGWLVYALAAGPAAPHSNRHVFAVLAGTLVRLFVVLGGALVIRAARPQVGLHEFLAYLAIFYVAALVLETRTLLRQISA
jgi:hypothetical protein